MIIGRRKYDIAAGDLKDTCVLMQPVYVSDGQGGSTVTYTDVCTVWCKAEPSPNTRILNEGQENFYDQTYFIIRNPVGIGFTEQWNIRFNGKTFTIHGSYDMDNRYQYLKILAYSKNL